MQKITPKWAVLQPWSHWKKNFFFFKKIKKFLPGYWPSKPCAEFLLNKLVSRYLTFGDFTVPKNCSSQKNIDKTRKIKKKNSAHRFGKNYFTNFFKIRLNPKELEFLEHNHKKQQDSLEVSLDRVLFAVEIEFLKMLVPRLPENTSNVNIERAGKSKQQDSLSDQLLGELIYLNFIILILICF